MGAVLGTLTRIADYIFGGHNKEGGVTGGDGTGSPRGAARIPTDPALGSDRTGRSATSSTNPPPSSVIGLGLPAVPPQTSEAERSAVHQTNIGSNGSNGNDSSAEDLTEEEVEHGPFPFEPSQVPDVETAESGFASKLQSCGSKSVDIPMTVKVGHVGLRSLGEFLRGRDWEAKRDSKINTLVFGEESSVPDATSSETKPDRPAALCHTRPLTDEEEVTALLEVEPLAEKEKSSDLPTSDSGKKLSKELVEPVAEKEKPLRLTTAHSGKKVGIEPGIFFVPLSALSWNEEIDLKNAAIVDRYNNISMVLRTKHLSVLFSKVKDGYIDDIEDEAVKNFVGDMRTDCRRLRLEVLSLGGTPIREPAEYWCKKYHHAKSWN